MEPKGRMTAEETAYYLKQVERRGKARSLPREELEKWRKDYDRITAYLRREYGRFLLSRIVRRNAFLDAGTLERLAREGTELYAAVNRALNEGDAEDFSAYCWLLHLRYMVIWKIAKEEADGRL